ncbi:MAG: DUF2786 domain-containing protein [Treponemataceae bacterium]|nr:DUF2786 domain-containing protein [Treponemataceae bacterium]
MDELETIKRKIKKLLALSKSPNENEAIAALQKANDLMAEHRIERAELAEYTMESVKATKRLVQWRIILANAVEQLYATCHYADRDGNYVFLGEELDVYMSTEMYRYLVKCVDRMAARNIRRNAKYRYRQSYRKGVASCIYNRIHELGQQCSWRTPKDLAQKQKEISDWVERRVSFTYARKRPDKQNTAAFLRGMHDGDGVSLSRQMTGSNRARLGNN